jgi:hypothetical protein
VDPNSFFRIRSLIHNFFRIRFRIIAVPGSETELLFWIRFQIRIHNTGLYDSALFVVFLLIFKQVPAPELVVKSSCPSKCGK